MSKRWKTGRGDGRTHILALGLNDSEAAFLQEYSEGRSWELFVSQSDLDGWDHADHEKYDLCIVGQSDENMDIEYLAWLMKDIMTPSRLILVISNCTKQELKHLRKYRVRYILHRPLDAGRFGRTVERALLYQKPWYVRMFRLVFSGG